MTDVLKLAEEVLWLPIHGWDDVYEVSSTGQVRRIGGSVMGQWVKQHEGYCRVRLSHLPTGKRCTALVHRLVAKAFVPNPGNFPIVNHLDSDVSNNSSNNLEWCTQKQNIQHAASKGRMKCCWKDGRGPTARFTDDEVVAIYLGVKNDGVSQAEMARRFGVSHYAVSRIVGRHTYKYVDIPQLPPPPTREEVGNG